MLVPPDGTMRDGIRPGWEHGFFDVMRQKLLTDRAAALRQAQDHRRAGLRADQIQPADRPVHAKRQGRRAVRMAVNGSDAQSPQAPRPLDRRYRLNRRTALTRTVPRNRPDSRSRCLRIFRQPRDFALVGGMATVSRAEDDTVAAARVVMFGVARPARPPDGAGGGARRPPAAAGDAGGLLRACGFGPQPAQRHAGVSRLPPPRRRSARRPFGASGDGALA